MLAAGAAMALLTACAGDDTHPLAQGPAGQARAGQGTLALDPAIINPAAQDQAAAVDDPAEPANRVVFDANNAIDSHTLKPVAKAYRETVPGGLQHGLHNMLTNLQEPTVGFNDLLQGNPGRAAATLWRFTVNTTAGGLGILDIAADMGIEHHDADFGQTFGVWGIGAGPYLTLPLIGPSTVRDAAGLAVGAVLNPFSLARGPAALTYAQWSVYGGQAFDARVQNYDGLDELERGSVDFYAALRSVYLQHRQALVADGKTPGAVPPGPVEVDLPPMTPAPLPPAAPVAPVPSL